MMTITPRLIFLEEEEFMLGLEIPEP